MSRLRVPLVLLALALLAVITMAGDRRSQSAGDLPWWQAVMLEIATPLQKVVTVPVEAVAGVWTSYVDLTGVRRENESLRRRVAALEEDRLQYQEALVSSGHLHRIAAMRDDFEIPMLPAEVVGLDVSPWFRSVLVDRGTSHGVQAGNPVITHRGVIGLVTGTSAHASRTMLLLDRQSAIDGIVQRTRARGIVRGRGTEELAFEFVVRGADVREGDVVITSALGGVYPKGLRLGVVGAVSQSGGKLLQTVPLIAAADFGRLEQVFIMLRRGPTMELLYGSNSVRDPELAPDASAAAAVTDAASVTGAAEEEPDS